MNLEATTTFDREQLLDEVVTAYLKEVQAGHKPEPQAWLARYPQLEAELAEFFADRAALAGLPEDQRRAVELHHLHGLPVEEVARELGRNESAAGGLLRRGLKRLRELMREPTGDSHEP